MDHNESIQYNKLTTNAGIDAVVTDAPYEMAAQQWPDPEWQRFQSLSGDIGVCFKNMLDLDVTVTVEVVRLAENNGDGDGNVRDNIEQLQHVADSLAKKMEACGQLNFVQADPDARQRWEAVQRFLQMLLRVRSRHLEKFVIASGEPRVEDFADIQVLWQNCKELLNGGAKWARPLQLHQEAPADNQQAPDVPWASGPLFLPLEFQLMQATQQRDLEDRLKKMAPVQLSAYRNFLSKLGVSACFADDGTLMCFPPGTPHPNL